MLQRWIVLCEYVFHKICVEKKFLHGCKRIVYLGRVITGVDQALEPNFEVKAVVYGRFTQSNLGFMWVGCFFSNRMRGGAILPVLFLSVSVRLSREWECSVNETFLSE